jgi:hypothetical protein
VHVTAFVDPLSHRYCCCSREKEEILDEVIMEKHNTVERYVRVSEREHAQQDDKDGIKTLSSSSIRNLSQQKN